MCWRANCSECNDNGRTKPGKLELCQRGTLFLDEITEMPMSLQAKLLHVLRDGYFVRPSGDSRIEMDVRILAATQVNIEQAIADTETARRSLLPPERVHRACARLAAAQRGNPAPAGPLHEPAGAALQPAGADFFRGGAGSLSAAIPGREISGNWKNL